MNQLFFLTRFTLNPRFMLGFSAVHSTPSCFDQATYLQPSTLALSNYFTWLYSTSTDVSSVDQLLTRSWEIEDVSGFESKQFTPEEQQYDDFSTQMTSRTAELMGTTKLNFNSELLFNSDAPPIGESFNQATGSFLALETTPVYR